jgi:signal transduction histidine kinase
VSREDRLKAIQSDFRNRIRGVGTKRLRLRLYAPDGKIVIAMPQKSPPGAFTLGSITRRLSTFDGYVIEATCSTADIRASLHKLFWVQGAVFVSLLIVTVSCGWLLMRRLLAGVGDVSEAALRISRDGDFNCRVSARGGSTEINDLVDAFNTMNDNNRRLFNEVRSVTDDIAHELRTPLTRLRGAAEVTMGDRDAGKAADELAAVVSEECGEMLGLINSMLEITRTESGLAGLKPEPLELSEQLRRAHELFLPVAED